MICKKCDRTIPDDALFCCYCGRELNPKRKNTRRNNGTGQIYKRYGKWTALKAVYIGGERKTHSKGGFATKKEAEQYDAEVEEEDSLIGYTIIDRNYGVLGKVIDIDDQTANVLFIVEYNDSELMVPAAEDLVEAIDDEEKTIIMNLPQGLINLDEAETE